MKETYKELFNNYFYPDYCVTYTLQILHYNCDNIITKRVKDWCFKSQKNTHCDENIMWKKIFEKKGLNKCKLIKFTGKYKKSIKNNLFFLKQFEFIHCL